VELLDFDTSTEIFAEAPETVDGGTSDGVDIYIEIVF
jgi:hypothetical protein